jgi:KDO2-lipid IV(A) lauroyltransferase
VSAPPPARTPSLAHRIEYGALRSVFGAFGLLGRERALRAGAALGAAAYRPLGMRRRVVERQIAAAFPELDAAAVREIAVGAYRHLGRVAVETALLSRMGPEQVIGLFERVDNWELVEQRLALGRGLIAASGHLGNWELCAAYVAAHGVHVDAVIRRMGNPLFDAYVGRVRSRLGLTVVRDRESVRRTPRTLAAGGMVGILIDQAGLNIASTYANFFGRPAKTPRGAAVFALRFNAPLVFGSALRQPNGRYHLLIEDIPVVDTGNIERDVDAVVQAYTTVLERHIRLAPDQYFWHHRRWKQQPPNTPPELRDPVG